MIKPKDCTREKKGKCATKNNISKKGLQFNNFFFRRQKENPYRLKKEGDFPVTVRVAKEEEKMLTSMLKTPLVELLAQFDKQFGIFGAVVGDLLRELFQEIQSLRGAINKPLRTNPHHPLWLPCSYCGEWLLLLEKISGCGCEGAATCLPLMPCMISIVRSILLYLGDDGSDTSMNHIGGELERTMHRISSILSNCSGPATMKLTPQHLCFFTEPRDVDLVGHCCRCCYEPRAIQLQFDEYVCVETAARLWGGGIALSLALCEWFHDLWSFLQHPTGTAEIHHVVEIGCGPAAPSLQLLHLMTSHDLWGRERGGKEESNIPRSNVDLHNMELHNNVDLTVSDLHQSVVDLVKQNMLENYTCYRSALGEQYSNSKSTPSLPSWVSFCTMDLSQHSALMDSCFDLILASDIIYDAAFTCYVPGAIASLLKPRIHFNNAPLLMEDDLGGTPFQRMLQQHVVSHGGGICILCCEAHRDGVAKFGEDITVFSETVGDKTKQLEIILFYQDVQGALFSCRVPRNITTSTIVLFVLRLK